MEHKNENVKLKLPSNSFYTVRYSFNISICILFRYNIYFILSYRAKCASTYAITTSRWTMDLIVCLPSTWRKLFEQIATRRLLKVKHITIIAAVFLAVDFVKNS